ncbi:hypothetical protein CBG25_03940 [Arsenophonus sp. ENCA]|uniref:hypothetical protein n=1 Tax=Arsenophonus sp. ENCA TaxID=1987579 RepID=UPI000BDC72EB|nr:hypothetical protein [Arsenophonus sp. ENCA]PAV08409.1 hypothetical protein CBG25_03940 [Arsenophonus sp. ENCA]
MGQVAFDTLQASEELETSGISREQARAISLVVRKSHEVADVATKADIAEVNRNIADVRKDMEHRFEKTDAQIADVRKDLSAEISDVRKDMEHRFDKNYAQMLARFEKTDAQISLVRKDMEALTNGLLIKLSRVIVITIGIVSTIATLIIKFS